MQPSPQPMTLPQVARSCRGMEGPEGQMGRGGVAVGRGCATSSRCCCEGEGDGDGEERGGGREKEGASGSLREGGREGGRKREKDGGRGRDRQRDMEPVPLGDLNSSGSTGPARVWPVKLCRLAWPARGVGGWGGWGVDRGGAYACVRLYHL